MDKKTTLCELEHNSMAVEYTMNIYLGCSHECIYCFARGEYYNIPDYNHIRFNENALQIIKNDFSNMTKRGIVTTGGAFRPL